MGTQQRKMKAGFSQAPKVHIKKFFSQARKQVNAAKGLKKKTGSRLYVKGVVASFKRSQAKQYNHTNLIKIQGVETTKDAEFYYGKKIMYVYRAHNTKDVKITLRILFCCSVSREMLSGKSSESTTPLTN